MITIRVEINNHTRILEIKAVRIEPIGRTPSIGEQCLYEIYIDKDYAGQLTYPFGDGIELSRKMFDHYELFKLKTSNEKL